jgi:hypothetical protein
MAVRSSGHARSEPPFLYPVGCCNTPLTLSLLTVQPHQRHLAHRTSTSTGTRRLQAHVRRRLGHRLVGAQLLLPVWQFGQYHGGQGGRQDRVQGVYGCRGERSGSQERGGETGKSRLAKGVGTAQTIADIERSKNRACLPTLCEDRVEEGTRREPSLVS